MRSVRPLLFGLLFPFGAGCLFADTYVSPFAVTLDPQISSWTTDFSAREDLIVDNSTPAPANWTTHDYSSLPYGPLNPQLYSTASISNPTLVNTLEYDRGQAVLNAPINTAPGGVSQTTWQQQRLMAAAQGLIGTHYQHLHLPTFNPAAVTGSTFPWIPVSTNATLQTTQQLNGGLPGTAANPYAATYGSPQQGIDCTDFSAYIYNLALGIQLHSGTASQIEFAGGIPEVGVSPTATVADSEGEAMSPNFLLSPNYGTATRNAPGSLDSVLAALNPGDLLYMKGAGGGISHVVVWLGAYGTNADGSPSSVPLVISSHDNTPAIFDTQAIDPITGYPLDMDFEGHLPPPGVQILPFTPENWFYQNFSVAMQVVPEPSTGILLAAGLAWLVGSRRRSRCGGRKA